MPVKEETGHAATHAGELGAIKGQSTPEGMAIDLRPSRREGRLRRQQIDHQTASISGDGHRVGVDGSTFIPPMSNGNSFICTDATAAIEA